ncbi:rhamnogalacturonidase [Dyadobacter fermentans]|uniref:Glycoside hydrolase family 28 n=1 Tax=Dyadobacter fermentans (strain ATCC 700827 / DSM 18053 / CIP 107007 / KCTC 52180 / NS114) TaxID=471854 RepID=C6VRS1_DYAFD|nr:glycosyl hydrolase family 28 protein [Dyadobacter fermentans]ACT92774.1 glycoside hydrolase family 28 [Dyadobacter fermentans DSM 18053]
MKKYTLLVSLFCCVALSAIAQGTRSANFPDGTQIPDWFSDTSKIQLSKLGKQYVLTEHGVGADSNVVQTARIQQVIDRAHSQGGGVIVVPKGVFLSGALFFKPKTHLYLADGAVLKGSDQIADYPMMPSRMEGQNLDYFPALVNAYGVNGFTISGKGTIDGNGLNYWKAFWQRRKENPNCTNLEVSRPRLVFIWKSNDVQVQDVKLRNSGFWTSHYYQCNNIKILNVTITAPHEPIKAPSTDAIDLDVCNNVLVKGCYLAVNDDAIALKGGKGPYADKDPGNGANTNIIIEDTNFGFCHAALTLGSEAIHNKNVIMRNCHIENAMRVLWLKMRPDTPQKYEFVSVENVDGYAYSLIYVKPWKQFFDLKGRTDVPLSYSDHISLKNIKLKCEVFFDVSPGDYDKLSRFHFENLDITAKNVAYDKSVVRDFTLTNVKVNDKLIR